MEALQDSLMPDVYNFSSLVQLHVDYDGVKVEGGNEFKCNDVQKSPNVSYTASEGAYYTLAMVDPDVTRKLSRHWLVTNIPGGDVSQGENLTPYKPSAPPFGGGYHRYFFLLYKQPGKQEHEVLDNQQGRAFFNMNEWAKKYGLELQGHTFFIAQRLESEGNK